VFEEKPRKKICLFKLSLEEASRQVKEIHLGVIGRKSFKKINGDLKIEEGQIGKGKVIQERERESL
jgi:hypothetical protein